MIETMIRVLLVGVLLLLAVHYGTVVFSDFRPLKRYNLIDYDYVKAELPPLGDVTYTGPRDFRAVINLKIGDEGACTGFVIDEQYAITAAHCIDHSVRTSLFGKITTDPIYIYDTKGEDTGIIAEGVCMINRNDFGLIQGNFNQFKKLHIESDHHTITKQKIYVQCGFPYGQKNLTCSLFKPITNDGFWIWGIGLLTPGQSGGPVFDMDTNKVVALNSIVYSTRTTNGVGGVGVSPLVGLPSACGVER